MTTPKFFRSLILCSLLAATGLVARAQSVLPPPEPSEHVVMIGNALGERMQYFAHFETLLHLRFPGQKLYVRSMAHSGDTPAYRPRPGRKSQWAFPGAEKFRPEFAMHLGEGHFPSDDQWLTLNKADTILAFFGFNESFDGPARVQNFADEVAAFVDHSLQQNYSGRKPPRVVLISPIAFEDLSATQDLPNGQTENANLRALHGSHARRRCEEESRIRRSLHAHGGVVCGRESAAHDQRRASQRRGVSETRAVSGRRALRSRPNRVTGVTRAGAADGEREKLVLDERLPILNGVHVYGRRYNPFGDENYPEEIAKIREMTALRDQRL